MVLTAVRDVLVSAGAVTDICGDRVEMLTKPQAIEIPCLCLSIPVTTPINGLLSWNGLDSNLVQIDSYSDTYTQAKSLAAASRAAMESAGNQMENEIDNFEQDVDLSGLVRITQQYTVWS